MFFSLENHVWHWSVLFTSGELHWKCIWVYTGMNSHCNVGLDQEDKHGSALVYFTSLPRRPIYIYGKDNHPNCRWLLRLNDVLAFKGEIVSKLCACSLTILVIECFKCGYPTAKVSKHFSVYYIWIFSLAVLKLKPSV